MNDLKTELSDNEQEIIQRIVDRFKSQGRNPSSLDYLQADEITQHEKKSNTALESLIKKHYCHRCNSIDELISLTPTGYSWAKNNELL